MASPCSCKISWFKSLGFLRTLTNQNNNRNLWWRHQMETFPAILAICAGNSAVTGEFPAQRPVTRSFYVFFDLRLNKRLSKQLWGWWLETPSSPLWRHCNVFHISYTRQSEYRRQENYIHGWNSMVNVPFTTVSACSKKCRRWRYSASVLRSCDITILGYNKPTMTK